MGVEYTLHYWPSIPGRGEYVRLAFIASGTPFKDSDKVPTLTSLFNNPKKTGVPPHFAPPILQVKTTESADAEHRVKRRRTGGGESATDGVDNIFLSQTPAILAFLAPRLGLAGDVEGDTELEREARRAHVNQVTLTALDLSNETHDVHHPVSISSYYEDQKDEALVRAKDFREERIPKFFKYFEEGLKSNNTDSTNGQPRLVGGKITTADLVLFQVLSGLHFAFPRLLASLEDSSAYPNLFAFYKSMGEEPHLKKYLPSKARRPFSNGLYRHYPELDAPAA